MTDEEINDSLNAAFSTVDAFMERKGDMKMFDRVFSLVDASGDSAFKESVSDAARDFAPESYDAWLKAKLAR